MTTTIQVQIPISLNDGQLMLVKLVDVDYPPRPGDRVWDASFTDLMGRCGNVLAEAVVEESGVDIDEETVVLMCRESVLDTTLKDVLADSAFNGWGNDYEFERN